MANATRRPGARLSIRLSKNIKKEQVDNLFAKLYELNGCLRCGLGGFDIEMLTDPVVDPAHEIGQIEGVGGAVFH
ncbi:MAG: hypothetical protein JO197_20645 [Acidobacteria bacterium]|nr:hypothetical protein [Acidobacteriota bacterium]MBV9474490.1 hypothetical protein [Acidobacteriota bacterium]